MNIAHQRKVLIYKVKVGNCLVLGHGLQCRDAGQGLGVEDDEDACDAVTGCDGGVAEQAPGDVPALVLVERTRGDLAAQERDRKRGGDVLSIGPS